MRHRSPPARPACRALSPNIRDRRDEAKSKKAAKQRTSTWLSTSFRRDAIGACSKHSWGRVSVVVPQLTNSKGNLHRMLRYTTSHICRYACALRVSNPCSAKGFFQMHHVSDSRWRCGPTANLPCPDEHSS